MRSSSASVAKRRLHAEHLLAHRPVRDELRDVDAEAGLEERGPLPGQVDRPTAIGVDEHGGDALGEQRHRRRSGLPSRARAPHASGCR